MLFVYYFYCKKRIPLKNSKKYTNIQINLNHLILKQTSKMEHLYAGYEFIIDINT